MRSWDEELGASWLADVPTIRRADGYVRRWLAKHRALPAADLLRLEDVAPHSVESLVGDIRDLAIGQRWIWVTTALVLLAELLFGAKKGGIFELDARRGGGEPSVRALYRLRNVACHPAHANRTAGAGPPHMHQLIDHLRGNMEDQLASSIEQSWAFFAERPVAVFALRMANAALRVHPDTKHLVP